MSLDIKGLDSQLKQATTRVGELHIFQKGKQDPQRHLAPKCRLILRDSTQTSTCQISTTGSRLLQESSTANSMILSTLQHDKIG